MLALMSLGVFVAGLVFLLRLSVVQIKHIEVIGNKIVPSGEITASVQSQLDGFYFKYIPRTNIFFYPRQEILKNITSAYPRFNHVTVDRRAGTLRIGVVERVPAAIMCTMPHSADCYLIDSEAIPYAAAPDFSEKIYVAIYSATSTSLGTPFIAQDMLNSLLLFGQGMTKYGLPIKKILLPEGGDTIFVTATGTEVYIRSQTTAGFDTALTNLGLFLDKIKIKIHPKLESIDMRYGNSVFYK